MFECPHCRKCALIWQSDFDFEDYGYEGNGIVQNYHCSNCGADVEIRILFPGEEEK